MNLEDVIDPEYGLQQDEWSLTRPKFGDQGQLEVIGWSGRNKSGNKLYLARCDVCAQDHELFGDGVFKSLKGSLMCEQIPCGCSCRVKWTAEQYKIRCTRQANGLGYVFLDWAEPFTSSRTKLLLYCPRHGEWNSTSLNSFLSSGHACPACRTEVATTAAKKSLTKPDHEMIASFHASGQFPTGTQFWRSMRLNSEGTARYWHVHCPECNYTGEAESGSLQKGSRPCLCSRARQKQAYINWIVGDGGQNVALKFGIANVARRRVRQQNKACQYEVRPYLVYEFPTKQQCQAAERECKETLECGILSQEEMPDGYTETTCPSNLARIKSIYEKHGGVVQ